MFPLITFKPLLIIICLIILLPVILFAGEVDLPKTGQTTCYDEAGNVIDCSGTGQDGEIQAGVVWPEPRFTDNNDGTITDNLTGLVWLKNAGAAGSMTWNDAIDFCNSLANGAAELTDGSAAGDWRLPNIVELESLVNAEVANLASWLNNQGFTNVQSSYYWAATTYAYDTCSAWDVHMYYGSVNYGIKEESYYVWAVRDGQLGTAATWQTGQKISYRTGDDGDLKKGAAWPGPRFTDNGDGTVIDKLTGLIWLKNASAGGNMTWDQAIGFCKGLASGSEGLTDGSVAGDWRLPNRKELFSLIDYSQYNPAVPQNNPFENVQSVRYCSATTKKNSDAWSVYMESGSVNTQLQLFQPNRYYVRLVRAGQSGSLDLTLTYTAGTGGTITGDTSQTINQGADGTAVEAVPATGYHFTKWSDGSTTNPRTDTNVTANVSITAEFAVNTYTVTFDPGTNGARTGGGELVQQVSHGNAAEEPVITANTGWAFTGWSAVFSEITSNLNVTACYEQDVSVGDINGDGRIGLEEVIYILRQVAGE